MREIWTPVWTALKAAWKFISNVAGTLSRHNLTDWAAALTYYSLLATFPALIALVSVIGVFFDPQSTTETITKMLEQIGPDSAAATYAGAIRDISTPRSTAGVILIFGVIASIYTASSYLS